MSLSKPLHNTTTSTSGYSTVVARVVFHPSSIGYDKWGDYELRFGFNGYTNAHIEPIYTYEFPDDVPIGVHQPDPVYTNMASMPVRIRDGSADYIHLEICHRDSFLYIYVGCYGSVTHDFVASENGQVVVLHIGYGATIGDFEVTLTWTPVNIHPATVYITTPNPELYAGGPAQELIGVAVDASGQGIPGLSVAWSSSNPALFTVNANGVVTPVGAGTGTLTATINGVSGSLPIVVYPVQPLKNDLIGPMSAGSGEERTWSSVVHGGVPPYTYTWRVNTTVMQDGVGPDYSGFAYTNEGTDFTVNALVTDAQGRQVGKSVGVSVYSTCTPNCW